MRAPAVVVCGAPVHRTPRLVARLRRLVDPLVVAADGGASAALSLSLRVSVVVGDLDSLAPDVAAALTASSVAMEVHPRDKDATDGELAIAYALRVCPGPLWLLGFLGGPRLDQTAANLGLLTRLPSGTRVLDGGYEAILLRGRARAQWEPVADEIVSLVPVGSDALGVSAEGVRWPLKGERLPLGSTRGTSNAPAGGRVVISLEDGVLLAIRLFPR